jgi:arsenical pump membrane protein
MAGLAALAANLLNNLPATLVLVPLVARSPGLVLAALLGLNIGPNLTYVGSLATLLWRQVLAGHGRAPSAAVFVRLGLLTVPLALVAAVVALWASLQIGGVR